MKDCFWLLKEDSNNLIKIDLSDINISYQEENRRFRTGFMNMFSFGFNLFITPELRQQIGDYTNYNSEGLKREFQGWHSFDGNIRKGRFTINNVDNHQLYCTIESGVDQPINFDKKLSDIFDENYLVTDIYNHAKALEEGDIALEAERKKYRFPMVVCDLFEENKNDPNYEEFKGIYNFSTSAINSLEFERNEINNEWLANRNIIKPMPYLLWVLKEGFLRAGYILQGDVIDDGMWEDVLIFSTKHYHSTYEKVEKEIVFSALDFSENDFGELQAEKKIEINIPGEYSIEMEQFYSNGIENELSIIFEKEDNQQGHSVLFPQGVSGDINYTYNFDINNTGSHFYKIKIIGVPGSYKFNIKNIVLLNSQGDVIPKILNLPEINYSKMMPDITLSELVRLVMDISGYELIETSEGILKMNKITEKWKEVDNVKKIKECENEEVKSVFRKKRPYTLSFIEEQKQENQNKEEEEENIAINGYLLPMDVRNQMYLPKPIIRNNEAIGFIRYKGLQNGKNLPAEIVNDPLNIYNIKKRIEPILNVIYSNEEMHFNFIANRYQFRDIEITDIVYALGKRLMIKNMNKNIINDDWYNVEMECVVIPII